VKLSYLYIFLPNWLPNAASRYFVSNSLAFVDVFCVQASENLHSVKAKYPRKIAFYNVPYLAIESLEVMYRQNVAEHLKPLIYPDAYVCVVVMALDVLSVGRGFGFWPLGIYLAISFFLTQMYLCCEV